MIALIDLGMTPACISLSDESSRNVTVLSGYWDLHYHPIRQLHIRHAIIAHQLYALLDCVGRVSMIGVSSLHRSALDVLAHQLRLVSTFAWANGCTTRWGHRIHLTLT